jgi:hypothetical protein
VPVLAGRASPIPCRGEEGLAWDQAGAGVEVSGVAAEVAGSAGAGLRPTGIPGGRTIM